jgi:hypothetical protein
LAASDAGVHDLPASPSPLSFRPDQLPRSPTRRRTPATALRTLGGPIALAHAVPVRSRLHSSARPGRPPGSEAAPKTAPKKLDGTFAEYGSGLLPRGRPVREVGSGRIPGPWRQTSGRTDPEGGFVGMERAQARRKVKAEWDKLRALRKEWEVLNESTRFSPLLASAAPPTTACCSVPFEPCARRANPGVGGQGEGHGPREHVPPDGAPCRPEQLAQADGRRGVPASARTHRGKNVGARRRARKGAR